MHELTTTTHYLGEELIAAFDTALEANTALAAKAKAYDDSIEQAWARLHQLARLGAVPSNVRIADPAHLVGWIEVEGVRYEADSTGARLAGRGRAACLVRRRG